MSNLGGGGGRGREDLEGGRGEGREHFEGGRGGREHLEGGVGGGGRNNNNSLPSPRSSSLLSGAEKFILGNRREEGIGESIAEGRTPGGKKQQQEHLRYYQPPGNFVSQNSLPINRSPRSPVTSQFVSQDFSPQRDRPTGDFEGQMSYAPNSYILPNNPKRFGWKPKPVTEG